MSYDISIGDYDANYTWNVAPLFYDYICEAKGITALDGLTGAAAVPILRHTLRLIDSDSRSAPHHFIDKYNPKNGWGSTLGAVLLLSDLAIACALNPKKKVRVS